jgi:hypothetical protein
MEIVNGNLKREDFVQNSEKLADWDKKDAKAQRYRGCN